MAKTPVRLQVDGFAEREVMMVSYEFERTTDVEGQPSGLPRGGRLNIRLKALNDGNPELMNWMVEPSMAKSGSVVFLDTRNFKEMKQIKFEGGYCVNFEEKWTEGEGEYELIQIVCQKMEFAGNVKFENEWS